MIYGVSNNDGTDKNAFYRYTDDNILTETIDSSYHKILLSHSSPDRSYYTLCHLEEMFDLLDLLMMDDSEDQDSVDSGIKLSVLY